MTSDEDLDNTLASQHALVKCTLINQHTFYFVGSVKKSYINETGLKAQCTMGQVNQLEINALGKLCRSGSALKSMQSGEKKEVPHLVTSKTGRQG